MESSNSEEIVTCMYVCVLCLHICLCVHPYAEAREQPWVSASGTLLMPSAWSSSIRLDQLAKLFSSGITSVCYHALEFMRALRLKLRSSGLQRQALLDELSLQPPSPLLFILVLKQSQPGTRGISCCIFVSSAPRTDLTHRAV